MRRGAWPEKPKLALYTSIRFEPRPLLLGLIVPRHTVVQFVQKKNTCPAYKYVRDITSPTDIGRCRFTFAQARTIGINRIAVFIYVLFARRFSGSFSRCIRTTSSRDDR